MFMRTDGDEPTGVLPITNHPVSKGRLCHRGWNRYQNLRNGNRILRPLIRQGSSLKEASWEEAFEKSAAKIADLLSRHGPQSIGVIGSPWLTNEENYQVSLFASQVLKSNNLDGSYRFSGASALTALSQLTSEPLGSFGSIPSLREYPIIIVLGGESLRDFSPVGSRVIQSFLNGGEIILCDQSCKQAEHFYKFHFPYSLEDLAFALQERKDLPDALFRRFAEAQSAALVFTADKIPLTSGLAALIRILSRIITPRNRIPLLLPLSRSPNFRGAWDMGIMPRPGGLNLQQMLEADSRIKGLIVFADDLLRHLPSPAMIERLGKLDLLIVADRFFTETTRIAHCLLPIPLFAEGEGTMTNCEGRVQKLRRACQPKGEARSLLEILPDLSRKLGNPLPQLVNAEVRKEISRNIPAYQKVISENELDSVSGVLLPSPQEMIPTRERFTAPQKPNGGENFFLLIPNSLYDWSRNQMILESPVLKIEYPQDRSAIRMNPEDSRDLRVRPGEKVSVKSEMGEALAAIDLDEKLPRRTLMVPSHLTEIVGKLAGKGQQDPESGALYYPSLPVTVEKI